MVPSLPLVITLLQLCWQCYHDGTVSAFSIHRSCITSSPSSSSICRRENYAHVPLLLQQPPGLAKPPSLRLPSLSKTHPYLYATKEKTNECVSIDTAANCGPASTTKSNPTSTSTSTSAGSSASTAPQKKKGHKTLLSTTKNNIFSTIDLLIEAQQKVKCVKTKPKAQPKVKTQRKIPAVSRDCESANTAKASENVVATPLSMGILGEKVEGKAKVLTSDPEKSSSKRSTSSSRLPGTEPSNVLIEKIPIQNDVAETAATAVPATLATEPGTILIPQKAVLSRKSLIFKNRLRDHISINVAKESNDAEIANLRLSVFSDYSMDQRKEWIDKSCEVIRSRRLKGATCLSASVNYIDDTHISSDDYYGEGENDYVCADDEGVKSISGQSNSRAKYLETRNWIVGSIECSTHEFHNSALGMRRPAGSILYITEVAVSPRTRRSGAGELLLKVCIIMNF